MKRSSQKSAAILLGIILTIVIYSANGQDWTGWRGTDRDGKTTDFKIPASWPEKLNLQWQITVGEGDASPSLAGNMLYVHAKQGDNDIVMCIDASTGKELWRESSPTAVITGPASSHPGPRSTPEVAEGKVITLGAGGILTCLDAASGKVLWKNTAYTNEVPAFFVGSSPLIHEGNCYIHMGGKEAGSVVAFDLKTGVENWKWTGDPPTYSSPVIMNMGNEKLLIVQTGVSLVGLRLKDGKLLFRYPMAPERRFYNTSTPVIDGENIFITGQGTGAMSLKVEKKGDSCQVNEVWSNKDFSTSFNTTVLKDGFLYGNEANMGKLFCLNASTGVTSWADTTKLDRFASVVDAGKIMVSLPASSSLIIFKPSGKSFEPVMKYKVADSPVYAHPILSGNRIFIKEKDLLTLWTID